MLPLRKTPIEIKFYENGKQEETVIAVSEEVISIGT
jgi:hypothetical protein